MKAQLTSSWTAYIVPSFKRAVIRQLTVTNFGAVGSVAYINAATAPVWSHAYLAGERTLLVETRVVLYAGERLEASCAGTEMWAIISGFLFDDPGTAGELQPPSDDLDFATLLPADARSPAP